jgi:hypothetical protein
MRYLITALFALTLTQGCISGIGPGQTDINLENAREVSDAFMSDLVSDRVDLALDKMEAEFVETLGRVKAETVIRELFDYCGRPLDQEFKHYELGTSINLKNGKRPMRKFYYAATTSKHPKGICFFSVAIVPSSERLKVATFGPLMLKTGQLPEWLK